MNDQAYQRNDLRNEPDAHRLILGLRDTGYNVRTAVADIIDNAIAAEADTVNVEIILNADGRKFVHFGDNGHGMDATDIRNAMRYGAPVRANLGSLGKFGLGLKTASSSVCKKFALISRKVRNAPLAKLAWDLDHVQDINAWEMLREDITSDEQETFDNLCGETGTLVIWSKCDRILSKEYGDPGGVREQQAINSLVKSLSTHLSLVYHRFLDSSDNTQRNVRLNINGSPVSSWNPFYPERSEQVFNPIQQRLEVELEDGQIEQASIKAWILPHSRDLTKYEQTLARISNKAQGFYVYREGRLIQDGGWMGVFGSPEPHTSLLRVEFDFGHTLDTAFKVDVKKSRILFDPALEEELRKRLHPVYREAGLRYRRSNRQQNGAINHTSANNHIASTPGTSTPSVTAIDPASHTATVSNNRGPRIRIRQPLQDNVGADKVHVEAVETITTGHLWQPALRSSGTDQHVTGILLNKHHDFYQKIYLRAAANGYAVEGMDLLLWAFGAAELNNTNDELEPIFEDIREEISSNLRKLLRALPDPEPAELNQDDDGT